MDGFEKLAQPIGGIYIYDIIDTFSRKVLALAALPNKKQDTVASWLVKEVNSLQGQCSTGNLEFKWLLLISVKYI